MPALGQNLPPSFVLARQLSPGADIHHLSAQHWGILIAIDAAHAITQGGQ